MTSVSDLLQQGATHAWLFVPTAILLGALHGLEPGHSKTMMAAFIIAVRGTVKQAVLLGLCATISHTAIVWIIALGGLYLWRGLAPDTLEPYLQVASAVIILGIGAWMLWRTRREQQLAAMHGHHHGDHDHDAPTLIDTGHGVLRLEIFEKGVPPRFRLSVVSGDAWSAGDVSVETERPDGAAQLFRFVQRPGYLESDGEISDRMRSWRGWNWRTPVTPTAMTWLSRNMRTAMAMLTITSMRRSAGLNSRRDTRTRTSSPMRTTSGIASQIDR